MEWHGNGIGALTLGKIRCGRPKNRVRIFRCIPGINIEKEGDRSFVLKPEPFLMMHSSSLPHPTPCFFKETGRQLCFPNYQSLILISLRWVDDIDRISL